MACTHEIGDAVGMDILTRFFAPRRMFHLNRWAQPPAEGETLHPIVDRQVGRGLP
jgi:hypothetical protein